MKELSALLPKALRNLPRSRESTQSLVFSFWIQAVQGPLAQRTRPFRLYKSTLVVSVPSEMWKRELHAMRQEILGKLRQVMGENTVLALEFRVDPNFDQESPQPDKKQASASVSSEPIALPLDNIRDPELSRIVSAAASSYFKRPEKKLS